MGTFLKGNRNPSGSGAKELLRDVGKGAAAVTVAAAAAQPAWAATKFVTSKAWEGSKAVVGGAYRGGGALLNAPSTLLSGAQGSMSMPMDTAKSIGGKTYSYLKTGTPDIGNISSWGSQTNFPKSPVQVKPIYSNLGKGNTLGPTRPITARLNTGGMNIGSPDQNARLTLRPGQHGGQSVTSYTSRGVRGSTNRRLQEKAVKQATQRAAEITSNPNIGKKLKAKQLENLRKQTTATVKQIDLKEASKQARKSGQQLVGKSTFRKSSEIAAKKIASKGIKKAAVGLGAGAAAMLGAPIVAGGIAAAGTAYTLYEVGTGLVNVVGKKRSSGSTKHKW